MNEPRLLPCTIEPGAFSSERAFLIEKPPDWSFKSWTGVCDVQHVLNRQRQPLAGGEPLVKMAGYVRCAVLQQDENRALVELPDGRTTSVPNSMLEPVELSPSPSPAPLLPVQMDIVTRRRGFEDVVYPAYPVSWASKGPVRVVGQSSSVGDYDDSMSRPGTSALWVGEHHHLNREEVWELRDRLSTWLRTGSLRLPNDPNQELL